MNALLSVATALLVTAAPARVCYVPSDQSAGWKQVALPEDAPALAAPPGIEQFRTGERTLLSEEDPRNVYLGASRQHPGRMAYTFRLPRGTFRLGLSFLDALDGAKVDVTAYAGPRAYPLLSERRRSGRELTLDWEIADVDTVVVEVHHHLRETPVVRHWRVDRQVIPSQEAVSPGFQAARSLFFLHPGGARLELCEAPGQQLMISRWPEGVPTAVALTRARAEGP